MAKSKEDIEELLKIAVAADLEGLDFLSQFTPDQLADGYNGIGPEFLKPRIREKVSEFLSIFAPAAVGHDLRNELSDGSRKGFCAANEEFLRNCLRLADYHYRAGDPRRRRARAAARVLYLFVSAENFGWRAWLEAKERHAAKLASGDSVWKDRSDLHPTNPKRRNMKNTMKDTAKQLAFIAACVAAAAFCGCSVTKVNYEKDDTGKVSYRLYRNDHWLKTSGTGLSGGMTKDGKFEFAAEGLERSPSEEFNRTMQTYTTAFVQLAQIAAAAYNPSASAATKSAEPAQTVVNVQPASQESQTSQDCSGDDCKDVDSAACTGDACKDK